MKKRIICLVMAMLLIMSVFVSCGKNEAEKGSGQLSYSDIDFTDIYGKEYKNAFNESKVTVVNLFATWCGPCVRELPELQKLSEKYKDKGIAVIGIVTDASFEGQIQNDVVKTAKKLVKESKVTYPMLVPDETGFKGYIDQMDAFPETLFIDSNGNIIRSVVGSNSFEGWSNIVESVVKSLEN